MSFLKLLAVLICLVGVLARADSNGVILWIFIEDAPDRTVLTSEVHQNEIQIHKKFAFGDKDVMTVFIPNTIPMTTTSDGIMATSEAINTQISRVVSGLNGKKIDTLVIYAHGATFFNVTGQAFTSWQGIGDLFESGPNYDLKHALGPLIGHMASDARIVANSCNNFCGTEQSVVNRAKQLLTFLKIPNGQMIGTTEGTSTLANKIKSRATELRFSQLAGVFEPENIDKLGFAISLGIGLYLARGVFSAPDFQAFFWDSLGRDLEIFAAFLISLVSGTSILKSKLYPDKSIGDETSIPSAWDVGFRLVSFKDGNLQKVETGGWLTHFKKIFDVQARCSDIF